MEGLYRELEAVGRGKRSVVVKGGSDGVKKFLANKKDFGKFSEISE